ncbi:hypothetical protein E4U13_007340 [Claviceps humidiphila]|uniref:Uncharacterized protein n=1 Tax=Claviceps humidiphila TaxID=1294629 RepID=A0A9P7TQ70_9HYPO|nr:hypothetical protein E4U13_007340 [Claviceps humidiphila]
MQLLSAILVAVAATGAVADIPVTTHKSTSTGIHRGPAIYPRWCNHGTSGDGGCEANGRNTYCVRHSMNNYKLPIYTDMYRLIHTRGRVTSADVQGYTVQHRADPLLRGLSNDDGCFKE